MRQAAPKATPPASRKGERRGGEKGTDSGAIAAATPNCVLGALPSPFGSASAAATATPGSDATCRVTTRRQSRLSAAAAANAAEVDAATAAAPATAPAASPKPQQAAPAPPLPADSLFAPLAAGLELRTRSSLSFEDKVTASSATLLDPSPSLLDPETFAFSRAFDFERVIGRSELSEVWLARHRGSGRRFAVKRSAPPPGAGGAAVGAAAGGQINSKKTAREVSVVSRVPPHPNLVGVQRSWREAGSGSFIQMDYCRGGSLAEAVRRAVRRSKRAARRRRSGSGGDGGEGERREHATTTTTTAIAVDAANANADAAAVPAALPEAAVWRVAAHAAAALEALHASRVIHMDVKPENIYLDWKEEEEEEGKGGREVVLRLGDFGLSITAEDAATPWEEGDGRYVAPELLSSSSSSGSSGASSSPRPTPAADVFSLGATLFECATGNPPPRGGEALPAAEAAAAVVAALGGGGGSGPSSSSSPSPSSSAALLAGLVASAMLRDPQARPSAAQLARASAEGDARFRRREEGSAGEADAALVAGLLPPPAAAAAAAGAHHLGSAPSFSFSLLRRSDARRRGYTLDGSASLSLSLDADDGDEEQQQQQKSRGGCGKNNNKAVERACDDDFDDDFDDDEESDALFFSRPPSAPRAGHSRRRTPRSLPSSPGREVKMKEVEEKEAAGVPPLVPGTTATTAAAASGRPSLSPFSLDPLVEAMSIGGGGGVGGGGEGEDGGRQSRRFFSPNLDLDRALSSMSIDDVRTGTENNAPPVPLLLSPGSPARCCSPWPVCSAAAAAAARGTMPPAPAAARVPPPPRAPLREGAPSFAPLNAPPPSSSFRFGFGLPPAPAPSSSDLPFDSEQQQDLSVEGLGDTVRQLSMSLSGKEGVLPRAPPSVGARR